MPKNKNTTIEDLAVMVQKGFLGMDKKFDAVYKRFDAVDKRFDALENRLDDLEARMTSIESRMGALETRMDSLEETDEEIIERLGRIEKLVDEDQQLRIARLENSMQKVYNQLSIK